MAVPLFKPVQDLDSGRPLLAVEFSQDQNEGSGHPKGPRPEPTCAFSSGERGLLTVYKGIMKGRRASAPPLAGERHIAGDLLNLKFVGHAREMSALPAQPEVHACVRFDFGRAHATGHAPHQRFLTESETSRVHPPIECCRCYSEAHGCPPTPSGSHIAGNQLGP